MLRATTSASNVFRRKLCPGSERLEEGLLDEDSPQSREGTLLHAYDANPALERAVLSPNQQDLLRIAAEADEFVFERVKEQFGISAEEPFMEWREKDLLALHGEEEETPGHSDRMRYYDQLKLLVIIDKKFGYKEVTPAAANYQLRVYAIGGAEMVDVDNVVVAITQPRLSYYQRVTMAAYSQQDVLASALELTAIRKASRDPDAPLHAGEEQCRYCKAKTKCPEFTKQLVPLDGGKEIRAKLPDLPPDQRDGLIRAVKFAAFIKDAVMDNEREVIASGGDSLYELGKPKNTREVVDVKRAVALLSLRGDLTRDEVMDACEMHFGALEEKLRLKTRCTWKAAKETIESVLAPVIERGTQKAPLTKKKEALE
jgi:hypothetical protein